MANPMNYTTILFKIIDKVAILTLNRPDRLNSFNALMHKEVRDALKRVQIDDRIRVLLLTGAGRGFCTGQDLSSNIAIKTATPDPGVVIEKGYNPLIRTLRGLEIPVICAVNGVAAGAGANLALACDIVLAARSATFSQSFCKIGLVPDAGGTWLLPRLVGSARAMALAMLGDEISAEQAAQWGMIWKCVDDAVLLDEADRLVRHLATQPAKGLALTKRALHAAAANSLDEQLDLERDYQRLAGRTEDFREGVAAFLEKREPVFKGR